MDNLDRLEVKLRHVEEQFEGLQSDYRSIKSSIEEITKSISELRGFSGEILFLHLMHLARDDARDDRVSAAVKKLKKAQNVARVLGNEDQVRDLQRQITVLGKQVEKDKGEDPLDVSDEKSDTPQQRLL